MKYFIRLTAKGHWWSLIYKECTMIIESEEELNGDDGLDLIIKKAVEEYPELSGLHIVIKSLSKI